jgi:hypothetical protein
MRRSSTRTATIGPTANNPTSHNERPWVALRSCRAQISDTSRAQSDTRFRNFRDSSEDPCARPAKHLRRSRYEKGALYARKHARTPLGGDTDPVVGACHAGRGSPRREPVPNNSPSGQARAYETQKTRNPNHMSELARTHRHPHPIPAQNPAESCRIPQRTAPKLTHWCKSLIAVRQESPSRIGIAHAKTPCAGHEQQDGYDNHCCFRVVPCRAQG